MRLVECLKIYWIDNPKDSSPIYKKSPIKYHSQIKRHEPVHIDYVEPKGTISLNLRDLSELRLG